jgi:uncharacterized protein YdeI (BOF family)
MQGVVVELGNPKSIVLFNNGRIRSLPTPPDCHVGMVISLKYNYRLAVTLAVLAAILLCGAGIFLGLTLSYSPPFTTRAMSIMEALNARDDAHVILSGDLGEPSYNRDDIYYTLSDATGSIMLVIEADDWDEAVSAGVSPESFAGKAVTVMGKIDIDDDKPPTVEAESISLR